MFKQVSAVTSLNIGELPRRMTSSLVMIVGVAGAVAAMLALLTLSTSATSMALNNASPSRALVLSSGATSEVNGFLAPAQIPLIAQTPGVAHDKAGRPLVQGMAVIAVGLTHKRDNVFEAIPLRGNGSVGLEMDPAFKLTAGRMYRSGANELIAGRTAAATYSGLDIGDVISLRGTRWTVVGHYTDGGGLGDSEIMADADTVLSAFARPAYQSVAVMLNSPHAFSQFRDGLSTNPQLSVVAFRYQDYVKAQARGLTSVLDFVAYLVGAVMAVGAIIAAVNTMYTAVDARTREIATLRAIGFGGGAVVVSVVVEALVLAIPGALLGIALVWLTLNNRNADVSGVSFPLTLSPALVILGVFTALLVGLIGALAPAIRAARLPVASALRAT